MGGSTQRILLPVVKDSANRRSSGMVMERCMGRNREDKLLNNEAFQTEHLLLQHTPSQVYVSKR